MDQILAENLPRQLKIAPEHVVREEEGLHGLSCTVNNRILPRDGTLEPFLPSYTRATVSFVERAVVLARSGAMHSKCSCW